MTINFDQYTNTLSVTDTAANADLTFVPKGTGVIAVVPSAGWVSGQIARINLGDAGSNIKSTASSGKLTLSGFDGVELSSRGASPILQFNVTHTASAVNYVQATGATTGANVTISTQGSDASVFGTLLAKGNGGWDITGNGASTFRNSAGANQFQVTPTTSAVNYVQVTGSGTGSSPQITTQGSDAIISLILRTKGTGSNVLPQFDGSVFFQNLASQNQFRVFNTASAVNYLQTGGSVAGSGLAIQATGSDTNIDLAFTPKGTGNVQFGTYTANMALTIQGYVEIKDSGGTVRRLAVIA